MVGANVTVNESELPAPMVAGSGVGEELVKPAPETPNADSVMGKAQTLRMVNASWVERQPVCTVPKSTSVGVKTMHAGFCCGTQTPALHVWPGPHAEHTLPEWPQAVALVPAG